LRNGAKNVYLVTLATPFMKVHPTWGGPTFLNYLFAVFTGMLIAFALLMILLPISWKELFAAAVFASACSSPLIVKFFINPTPKRISESIQNTWPCRPFLLAEAANYPEPQFKMLVIKGVADEATLALAVGKVGSVISRTLLQMSGTMGSPAFVLNRMLHYFVVWPFALGSLMFELEGWYFVLFLFLLPVVFYLIPSTFLGLAASVCMAFFGREFLFGCSRCEIEVDSAPDGKHAAIITLPVTPFPEADTNRRGHSIYQHPSCVPTIADWLGELGILGITRIASDGTNPHRMIEPQG
jgi:hypothetical protein